MNQKSDNDSAPSGIMPEEISELKLLGNEAEPDLSEIESVVSGWNVEACEGQFYFKEAKSHKPLSHEEMLALARRASEGDESAREKMILHNLLMVICLAHKHKNRGLTVDDLIQEGNLGLMRAVEKFDYRLGFKFSTYAWAWIKHFMRQAIANQVGPVRLPVHRQELRSAIFKAEGELSNRLRRMATVEEVATKTGCDRRTVHDILRGAGKEAFSLDSAVENDDGSDTSRHEIFPDRNSVEPSLALSAREELGRLSGRFRELLRAVDSLELENRDRKVFKRFYGLNGSAEVYNTLELTAAEFGLTRERVRQIVAIIWTNLAERHPELRLNGEQFVELCNRISELENLTGQEIDRESPEAIAGEEESETASPLATARPRRRRIKHIRASPALVHWTPNPPGLNPARAAIQLVSEAYEVGREDILGRKSAAHKEWARCLAVYIMRHDLHLPDEAICAEFSWWNHGWVQNACRKIDEALTTDQLVRQDVEKLRSHFRATMGLPAPEETEIP